MAIRKHCWLFFVLCAVALFGLACPAGAQMGPGMMGYGYGGYGPALSPEKQSAAQKLYAEFFKETLGVRQELIAKQYELNALLYNGKNADEKKVSALTKDVSGLRAKLYEARIALQHKLAKEDIPFMGGGMGYGFMGPGMMGGGMGYGMMGPGMMGGGMGYGMY